MSSDTLALRVASTGIGAELSCFNHLNGGLAIRMESQSLIEKVSAHLTSVGLKLDSPLTQDTYGNRYFMLTLRVIDPVGTK